jgi:hypothetical protein
MDTIRKPLYNAQQGYAALLEVWKVAKAHLVAGRRLVLVLQPETRTLAQNSHFHSLIGQIAQQIGGDLADEEDAKRILISAFKINTINDVDLREEWAKFGDYRLGRGLYGETVMLGTQSRKFSLKLGAAFITWLEAFGAEHGVKFKAREDAHA